MAPSRRKGASKAAAAAAARRQWKIGDLVLAKVKGFPAWPARVSEPKKWGYSEDLRKVFVYFFGTQQIAFCTPADVELFTEEKKESLLGKRHGKGADFVRAVSEIIDSYEESKKQDQVVDANGTVEVSETNENVTGADPDDNKMVESFHEPGLKEAASSPILRSGMKIAELIGDESDFTSLADAAVLELEKDRLHGDGLPSKQQNSNVLVTYSSRRRHENMQLPDCVSQRRVQPARRSRSSRVDTSRLQNFLLPHGDGNNKGDMVANVSRDRTGRRSKRLRRSPDGSGRHDVDSPPLVSNGSIEENDTDTTTLSDTFGISDCIAVESGCKSVEQLESSVEPCEREVEFSQRPEFRSHAVIVKKKRKLNRKRLSNDTIESTTGSDKIVASEADTSMNEYTLPSDPKKFSDGNSKDDGDEHLPLVKRARVRMGASPHRPVSVGEQNDIQAAEKMSEISSSISKQMPMSNCEENVRDRDYLSPSNTNTSKKLQSWGVWKNQPFSSLVDGEAALPPSKRLHRALEAMSANAAEDSQTSSDGAAVLNLSVNEYCSSSSGECFKVTVESRGRGEVGSSDDALNSGPSVVEETVKPSEEVAACSKLPNSDDRPLDDSSNNVIEALESGNCKRIDAFSLSNHTIETKYAKKNLKISPHLGKSGTSHDCSPGLVVHLIDGCDETESLESSKTSLEPEPQISDMSLTTALGTEKSPSPLQRCTDLQFCSAENNFVRPVELSQPLDEDKLNNTMNDGSNKNVLVVKSPNSEYTTRQEQHIIFSYSNSEEPQGDKTVSTARSLSSVTDVLDSGPRRSPLNTSACHMILNTSNNVVKNSCCSPEAHMQVDRQNTVGKLSCRAGPNVALASFEAVLGTLTRSKESIARATHIAIDCAKMGIAAKVVETLTRHLETESSLHRRVDLFFLVDSITQCSRGMKGTLSGVYLPAIQAVLPRLVLSAAPAGSNAQDNRRQCLKVLRVWQERRIFPESIIRHHIRELDALCCSSSSGVSSRSLKTERAFDDPIRQIEGMMVDEYGSNSSIQLPGFCMPPILTDGDGGSDSDEENFEAVTPERDAEYPQGGGGASNLAIEKHRHILEDVDGELEMEDVAPSCEAETILINGVGDYSVHAKYNQFEHVSLPFAPKAKLLPSPALPVSPPPRLPPPPPPPPSSMLTSSAFTDASANCLPPKHHSNSVDMNDEVQKSSALQSTTSRMNTLRHHSPNRRDYSHVPMQMPDTPCSSYSSQTLSHASGRSLRNNQAEGALHKGFHVRPPYPAPSNQFSYVQEDQRMPSGRDVLPPYSDRYHMGQHTDNGNYFRNRGRMKHHPRDVGGCWRSPPPFSGPCHQDIPRRPYGHVSYAGPPREPALPNHRWAYPPRASNHREFMPHRPPPGGPIPVSYRGGSNFWRPR